MIFTSGSAERLESMTVFVFLLHLLNILSIFQIQGNGQPSTQVLSYLAPGLKSENRFLVCHMWQLLHVYWFLGPRESPGNCTFKILNVSDQVGFISATPCLRPAVQILTVSENKSHTLTILLITDYRLLYRLIFLWTTRAASAAVCFSIGFRNLAQLLTCLNHYIYLLSYSCICICVHTWY